MEIISWTERVTNVGTNNIDIIKKGYLLKVVQRRRGSLLSHLVRHDDFFKNMLVGKVGKR